MTCLLRHIAHHDPNRARRRAGGRARYVGPALVLGALIAMAMGTGVASAAAPLYVSATAAGDPGCATASQTNPFRTLKAALGCSVNGTTINIGPGTFDGQVSVTDNVVLSGGGASTVIAQPAGSTDPTPTIAIADAHTVTVRNLTIDGGKNYRAPGIAAGSGSLTVSQATIINGGNFQAAGGGISVVPASGVAKVTVTNSTIAANYVGSLGGGIYVTSGSSAPSSLTVLDSTIANNTAVYGSGIAVERASLTVRDSTITGNDGKGAIYSVGINDQRIPFTLANTIVAANTGISADCWVGVPTVDGGHNVIGTGCTGFADGVNGNQVGTMQSPIDPVLGPLANNGGPTQTIAPLSGSPAIGAGGASDCQASPISGRDQRGMTRNAAARALCDVGAYDTGGAAVKTLSVNKSAKSDPACADASATTPFATLAGALACADNGTLIKVGSGTYAGQVTIDRNVVVQGLGASTVIAGPTTLTNSAPDITVADGRFVTLKNLSIDGRDQYTPGVQAGGGSLTIIDAAITRNANHGRDGGGISISGAREAHLTVVASTIDHNHSDRAGGGIAIEGPSGSTLDVVDSTIAANDVDSIVNGGGGGILVNQATTTIRDSTIAGNVASETNGGGGLLVLLSANAVKLTNTILAGNTAPGGSDCVDARPVVDGGSNVIGQNTGAAGTGCAGLADGINGDHVGTIDAPLDARLGALMSNTGPTKTMALLLGSPAIAAGNTADCQAFPVSGHDQRGKPRNVSTRGVCDIGAYDTGGAVPSGS